MTKKKIGVSIDKLVRTQISDKIKNKYCKNNKIKILRISYKENIIDKLNKTLKLC